MYVNEFEFGSFIAPVLYTIYEQEGFDCKDGACFWNKMKCKDVKKLGTELIFKLGERKD